MPSSAFHLSVLPCDVNAQLGTWAMLFTSAEVIIPKYPGTWVPAVHYRPTVSSRNQGVCLCAAPAASAGSGRQLVFHVAQPLQVALLSLCPSLPHQQWSSSVSVTPFTTSTCLLTPVANGLSTQFALELSLPASVSVGPTGQAQQTIRGPLYVLTATGMYCLCFSIDVG